MSPPLFSLNRAGICSKVDLCSRQNFWNLIYDTCIILLRLTDHMDPLNEINKRVECMKNGK